MRYRLIIGGGPAARERWGSGRVYKHRSSAKRRMRQISAQRDPGVATVWVVLEGSDA